MELSTGVASKHIVILAHSYKYHGKCIAGRELLRQDDGSYEPGPWIRPVTLRDHGQIEPSDCRCLDGRLPQVLDLVTVNLARHTPIEGQPENWLLAGKPWRWRRTLTFDRLEKLVEHPTDLWDADSSVKTDRLPVAAVANGEVPRSLYLIHLETCYIRFLEDSRPRLEFGYGDREYALRITDPAFIDFYRDEAGSNALVRFDNTYVCVSLGEAFRGDHYKLAAAVITPEAYS